MNDLIRTNGRITAQRYHDISCGHRVHEHESKCAHLHGHNYRIHFTITAKGGYAALDNLGRVLDFSVIKSRLCMWLEDNWDHKFLAWKEDPLMNAILRDVNTMSAPSEHLTMLAESFVWTPFNPTAENMAKYLVEVVGPQELNSSTVELAKVTIEETAKCWASYEIGRIVSGASFRAVEESDL